LKEADGGGVVFAVDEIEVVGEETEGRRGDEGKG